MSSLAGDSIKRNEFWRKFSELCGHWDDESTKKENLTEKNQFIRCSCCFKSLKKNKRGGKHFGEERSRRTSTGSAGSVSMKTPVIQTKYSPASLCLTHWKKKFTFWPSNKNGGFAKSAPFLSGSKKKMSKFVGRSPPLLPFDASWNVRRLSGTFGDF